jgi:hypothetical protein
MYSPCTFPVKGFPVTVPFQPVTVQNCTILAFHGYFTEKKQKAPPGEGAPYKEI